MNVFVIPSWYPSSSCRHTGIFIKEQSVLFARQFAHCNVGISTWGANEESLQLSRKEFHKIPYKLLHKHEASRKNLLPNCFEYFSPAFTWTRKILKGNIDGIVKANEVNLKDFQNEFGKLDIIHAHAAHPGGYIAMKLSEKNNIPYVLTEHMTPFPFETFIKKNGKISSYISDPIKRAYRVICVSEYLKESVSSQLNIQPEVMNNFIDDSFFITKKIQKNSGGVLKLLFVGRLVDQKGIDILLNAMSLLNEKKISFELSIGGDGEGLKRYQDLSRKLGLKNIEWLGELSREEVRNQLQACDVFVLPSRHENNPVVLLEALACGKPIIVTSCGGPEEMVNEKNGLVAKPESKIDLSNKISEFQSNIQRWSSTEIRADFMNRYSREQSCNRLKSIYEELMPTK